MSTLHLDALLLVLESAAPKPDGLLPPDLWESERAELVGIIRDAMLGSLRRVRSDVDDGEEPHIRARFDAILRLLLDSGDITPLAVRAFNAILDAEQQRT